VKWKDNKDVHFPFFKTCFSQHHSNWKTEENEVNKPREEVKKPKCALEYQKGMGVCVCVDLQDQVTALFPIMR
jgi:hypothetical protein